MLLAIDAGNTNVVFAVIDGVTLKGSWRTSTDWKRTGDEYAVWLTHLMALIGLAPADIDRAIVASVVPPVTSNLRRLIDLHFHCPSLVVGDDGVKLGIDVKIDRPEEVGADRLVNSIAATLLVPPPLVVIDFGTATTFDVVDEEGAYIGGVIAPGINLSVETLQRATARLPSIDIRRPDHVVGRNTVGAITSGIYWGYVGLLEGLISRIANEVGVALHVIATGGLAPLFVDAVSAIDRVDPDLTINGLIEIDRRNRDGERC